MNIIFTFKENVQNPLTFSLLASYSKNTSIIFNDDFYKMYHRAYYDL